MKLSWLLNLGVKSDYPEYINDKIIISNKIALIFCFAIAIPFVGISMIFFPTLTIIPVIGVFVNLLFLVLNGIGGNYISRILQSLTPFALAATYNAYLCQPGEEPVASIFQLMTCFSLVPFLIFDRKERITLYFVFSFMALYIIFFMGPINDLLDEKMEAAIIRTGFLGDLTRVIGFVITNICVAVLVLQNDFSKKKIETMVAEIESNNSLLKESESRLKENIKKIEEAQEQEKKRNWTIEGLSIINAILRKTQDENYDRVLSNTVKYVSANQGALFLLKRAESGEPFLELNSCYAYERKKHVEKVVLLGEGLIGQCALEKQTVFLTDIPTEYIKITSGLGTANPTCLLIVPLITNEEVFGVMELASFKKFEAFELQFLEKVGESIATTLSINQINFQAMHSASTAPPMSA